MGSLYEKQKYSYEKRKKPVHFFFCTPREYVPGNLKWMRAQRRLFLPPVSKEYAHLLRAAFRKQNTLR